MYTALSEVYDLFYEADTALRADYYASFLPQGGEGADIGCGTGMLTRELYRRGFRLYGVDASEQMLQKAITAARREGCDIPWILGKAENPPAPHALDFAMAANDVYNYVRSLCKAFTAVCAMLKPGGIFAFDISGAYKLREKLAGNTFSQTRDDTTYIWQNFRKGNKLYIDFTVFSPSGASYIKTSETQVQYLHETAAVREALVRAGFGRIRVYAFGTRRAPRDTTERIAFIAEKPHSPTEKRRRTE